MRDFILKNLAGTEGLDFMVLLLNNLVAVAAAVFIMFVYKFTYSGASYNRKFNISLGMITIITTSIMCVISNNVALSLGMVGALSIIRFRTAVKDVRDSAFIFWAIAVGIACGVSQFALIGIGSLFLFLFLLVTRKVIPDNRKLLIIRSNLNVQNTVETAVNDYFSGAAHQVVKSASGSSIELVYGIQSSALKRAAGVHEIDIVQALMDIEGVATANLIEQTDDIGR